MSKSVKFSENTAIIRTLRTIIPAMVLFLLAFALYSIYIGIDKVIVPIQQVGWGLLGIMLCLSMTNYLLRALRWLIFNRSLGIKLSPLDALITYFAGFALQMTPMKAGEALRLWLIAKRYNIGYQRVVPLLLADKAYDSVGLYLAALVGALGFLDNSNFYIYLFMTAGLLIVIKVALLMQPKYIYLIIGLLFRLTKRKRKRFWAGARAAFRGTEQLLKWKIFIPCLPLTLLAWFAETYSFSLALQSMGALVSMAQAGFAFVFGIGIGAITLSPGGLGGAEAGMKQLLELIGTPEGVALAAVLVIRLSTLWFAIGLGMLMLPIALRRTRNKVPLSVLGKPKQM